MRARASLCSLYENLNMYIGESTESDRERGREWEWEKREKHEKLTQLIFFTGGSLVSRHEAICGGHVYKDKLCDTQVRHRRMGHRLQRVQACHHSRQRSKYVCLILHIVYVSLVWSPSSFLHTHASGIFIHRLFSQSHVNNKKFIEKHSHIELDILLIKSK